MADLQRVLVDDLMPAKPAEALDVVQADPSDNRVLECALAGSAQYVVTGDEHLPRLGEYKGIQTLSPATCLALLQAEGPHD